MRFHFCVLGHHVFFHLFGKSFYTLTGYIYRCFFFCICLRYYKKHKFCKIWLLRSTNLNQTKFITDSGTFVSIPKNLCQRSFAFEIMLYFTQYCLYLIFCFCINLRLNSFRKSIAEPYFHWFIVISYILQYLYLV